MSDRERSQKWFADNCFDPIVEPSAWKAWQTAQATPPAEPLGYIGVDTFTALSGGETVVQCITPYRHMETDVAIYTTPPAESTPEMIEIGGKEIAEGFYADAAFNDIAEVVYRAMRGAAK
ncbi:MAG: hypothetical protein ACK52I_06615 [Pseudomonadota bacterium]|jgi:hypothetical protein